MLLLTWHATLVCLREEGQGLVQCTLPLAAGDPPPLDVDTDAMFAEGPPRPHPLLGPLALRASATGRGLSIARHGRYLCAEGGSAKLAFDRTAVQQWERFMPISAQDAALLGHIVAARWIVRQTRKVVPKWRVRVGEDFRLHLAGIEIDLEYSLARLLLPPDRRRETAPHAIRLQRPNSPLDSGLDSGPSSSQDDASLELVLAGPRSSPLIDTEKWPTRARRTAEMLTLAAHRQLAGREPEQPVLERDVAFLLDHGGPAALQDLLERLQDEAASDPASGPAAPARPGAFFGAPLCSTPLFSEGSPSVRSLFLDHEHVQHLLRSAQPGQALASLAEMVSRRPEDGRAWLTMGRLLHDAGAYADAARAWERCLEVAPDETQATIALGTLAGQLGRPLTAATILNAALDRHPDLVEPRALLAKVYGELGWRDLAAIAASRIPEGQTGWVEQTRIAAARALDQQRSIDLGQPSPAVIDKMRHANIHFAVGDLARCQDIASRLIASAPAHFAPHGLHARLLMRQDGLQARPLMDQDGLQARPLMDQDGLQARPLMDQDGLHARLLMRQDGLQARPLTDQDGLDARPLTHQAGLQAAIAYLRPLHVRFGAAIPYQLQLARLLHEAALFDEAAATLATLLETTPRADIFRLCAQVALCRKDADALSRITQAWRDFDDHDTPPAIFSIAAARLAGRLARLDAPSRPVFRPIADQSFHIVQFWHAPDIPADVAETMASWPKLNAGTTQHCHDAAAARTFIATHVGEDLAAIYDSAHHPAMQSDMFRLAYLAVHGGIYIDADEMCLRDTRPVFAALDRVQLIAVTATDAPPYVYNGFIAARPGCPIIQTALAELIRLANDRKAEGQRIDIWQVTGPGLLTRAIGHHVAHPGNTGDVLLLSEEEYRAFAATNEDLAYKRTRAGNWRLF